MSWKRKLTITPLLALGLAVTPMASAEAAALNYASGVGAVDKGGVGGDTDTCVEALLNVVGMGNCEATFEILGPPPTPETPGGLCSNSGVVRAKGTYTSYGLGTGFEFSMTGVGGDRVGVLAGNLVLEENILHMEVNAAAYCGVGGLDSGQFTVRVNYISLDV